MPGFDVTAPSAASPDAIWALLAHGRGWPSWAAVDAVDEERSEGLAVTGDDAVGAVRAFRTGRTVTGERVVEMEPCRPLVYEDAFNAVMRDYRAEVVLTPTDDGGTLIRWHGRYRTKRVPGFLLGPYLRRFMRTMADGLAAYPERQDPDGLPRGGPSGG